MRCDFERWKTDGQFRCSNCGRVTTSMAADPSRIVATCRAGDGQKPRSSVDISGQAVGAAAQNSVVTVRPCGGCGKGNLPQDHPLPAAPIKAVNYAKALWRDRMNGRQRRTAEQVVRLFTHCDGCQHFNRAESACSLCGCPVNLHVSASLDNKLAAAAEVCPDGRWPYGEIQRRNLMFYIMPLHNPSNVWQWHVSKLREYLPLFNGRRIVTIATKGPGDTLAIEPAEKVREAFGNDADKVEFLERPNDRNHWETPAFREMMGMVESVDQNEATFYFHAKGVRRCRQQAIRPWCEEIYQHNLGRMNSALESLRYWKACGIARRMQNPTNLDSGDGWHFAGTGFWFRHDTLFSRDDWKELVDHSHAVEAYLATKFSADEVFCLAHDGIGDVYDASTWQRAIAGNKPDDSEASAADGATVSILVVARNYGRYLRECLESCAWQTHRPLEIIYVDDGSDDNSLAIAQEFEGLKIIRLDHVGVDAARNRAAAEATGDCILFVDGDNVLPKDYLAKMTAALTTKTPFVYPDLAVFGSESHYVKMPEWKDGDLWKSNFVDTCSLMWKDAFEQAGGWVVGPWAHEHDWHLMLRLSCFGAGKRSGAALGYRRHGQSLSDKTKETDAEKKARQAGIVADAERWCVEKFGRMLTRTERDLGVAAVCEREEKAGQ